MKYLFRRYSYPTVLAFVAAAVLGAGTLLKPDHKQVPKPTISESEVARLEKFAQRKSLQGISKYFSDLAAQVSPEVVRVRPAGVSGLVWDGEGRIITAGLPEAAPDPKMAVVPAGGNVMPAQLVSASPDLPVAALSASGASLEPVTRARLSDIPAGTWVLQVARKSDGSVAFAPATFSGTAPATCAETPFREVRLSAPIPDGMTGGGVFDMDGGLLAVIVRCGGRETAMSVSDVEAVVRAGEGAAAAVLRNFGIRVGPAGPDIPAIAAQKGALVSETRIGWPGDRSGLTPGDVVVGCDGTPVELPDVLYTLLLADPASPHNLEVRRGRRLVRLTLAAGEPRGVEFERPPRGFVAAAIPPGTRAWRAGLREGDRVIGIDHRRPQTQATVERALAETAAPSYMVVERGGRNLGLVIGK